MAETDVEGVPQLVATPAPDAPVVLWVPSAPGPISLRALLGETFARYAADPIRLVLVTALPAFVTSFVPSSLGLIAVVGLLNLSCWGVAMALVDAGPHAISVGEALRRGFRRLGWLALTALAIGVLVFLVALTPMMIGGFAPQSGGGIALFSLMFLVAVVLAYWVIGRLLLAIPAVVIGRAGPGDAIGQSWRLTKRRGFLLRIVGLFFVASVLSAAPGSALGVLRLLDVSPVAVSLVVGVLLAIVAPLPPVALAVLYRRAGEAMNAVEATGSRILPPLLPQPSDVEPSPSEPATAESAAIAAAAPAAVPSPAPPLDGVPPTWSDAPLGMTARGRILATASVAVVVVSIGSAIWGLSQVRSGALSSAAVPPGQIQFGSDDHLAGCVVDNPSNSFTPGAPIAWIARFPQPVSTRDVVRWTATKNGYGIVDETEPPHAVSCLGSNGPETDIPQGAYVFTVYVNGQVAAQGGFSVAYR